MECVLIGIWREKRKVPGCIEGEVARIWGCLLIYQAKRTITVFQMLKAITHISLIYPSIPLHPVLWNSFMYVFLSERLKILCTPRILMSIST